MLFYFCEFFKRQGHIINCINDNDNFVLSHFIILGTIVVASFVGVSEMEMIPRTHQLVGQKSHCHMLTQLTKECGCGRYLYPSNFCSHCHVFAPL